MPKIFPLEAFRSQANLARYNETNKPINVLKKRSSSSKKRGCFDKARGVFLMNDLILFSKKLSSQLIFTFLFIRNYRDESLPERGQLKDERSVERALFFNFAWGDRLV